MKRPWHRAAVETALRDFPVVAIVGRRRLGFEFKRTVAPEVTKWMRVAAKDLRLDRRDIVHAGDHTYPLGAGIRAVALSRLMQDLPTRSVSR